MEKYFFLSVNIVMLFMSATVYSAPTVKIYQHGRQKEFVTEQHELIVTEKGLQKKTTRVSVKYTPPRNPLGQPNIQFSVSEENLPVEEREDMSEPDETIAKIKSEKDKKIVKDILAKDYHGKRIDAGEWHWIDIVNLTKIADREYGDSCGCGKSSWRDFAKGGYIQVRGQASDGRVLYEYFPYAFDGGTECSKGTLFFGAPL